MTGLTTVREALIIEALGDVATLIGRVEALAPMFDQRCLALVKADAHLSDSLAAFESRMAAISERMEEVR